MKVGSIGAVISEEKIFESVNTHTYVHVCTHTCTDRQKTESYLYYKLTSEPSVPAVS